MTLLQLKNEIYSNSGEETLGEFRRLFRIQRSIIRIMEGMELTMFNIDTCLQELLSQFYLFALQFERKPHGKSSYSQYSLKINNEYDIQHLLHA